MCHLNVCMVAVCSFNLYKTLFALGVCILFNMNTMFLIYLYIAKEGVLHAVVIVLIVVFPVFFITIF